MSPQNQSQDGYKQQRKASLQPIRNNSSTRTNIPKTKERAAIKAALSTMALSAKTPLPGPTAPGRRGARKRSPLPPQGLGYCSTRSSARAEEHLMCSSCEPGLDRTKTLRLAFDGACRMVELCAARFSVDRRRGPRHNTFGSRTNPLPETAGANGHRPRA